MSNYPKFKEIYERMPEEEKHLYEDDSCMDSLAIKEFCIYYTYRNYKGEGTDE